MGDHRFQPHLDRVLAARDRKAAIEAMQDHEVIAALAAASTRSPLRDPYIANILATEAHNRIERGRTIMESLAEGVLAVDTAGNITFANAAAQRLLGRPAAELIGQPAHETIHPRRPDGSPFPREECPHTAVLRTGQTLHTEDSFVRKDGSLVPVSCTTAPIRRGDDILGIAYAFHDVTHRREAERERDRAAARVNQILDSIGEGFLAVDEEWRITYLNRHAAETTRGLAGVDRDATLGRSLWDVFPGMRGTVFEEVYRRAMRERAAAHIEAKLPPHDAWFEVSIFPWAEGLSFYFRDVTERKRAQQALQESEARYRALVHASAQVVWTMDADGRVVGGFQGWRDVTGQTPEQMQGDGWLDAIHPDDRPGVEEAWRRALETRTPYEQEYRVRLRDGTYRTFLGRAVPVVDGSGALREWVSTSTEIRGRHDGARMSAEREQALAEGAADRYRLLVESVADQALCMLDLDGRVLTWNAGAARIEGYEAGEVMGRHYRLFFPRQAIENGLPEEALRTAAAEGRHEEEGWRVRKDGSRFWARVVLTPVRENGGANVGFAMVLRDLSERDEHGRQLAERARRQEIVAELGILALTGDSLAPLFEEAVERLRDVLAVDYTKILQLERDGRSLVLRAGRGWSKEIVVHRSSVSAGAESQAGHTLSAGTPVVVRDLRTESRFRGPPLLVEHGVVSGMSVIIHGRGGPWGVLGVHSRAERSFSQDDVNFLQTVANVLAHGIQRRQIEEELERRVQDRTARLEQAVRDLETFANTASHDLRAPLRGSAELARLLLEEHGKALDASGREVVERILRENEKATRLVHDLLAYARSTRKEIREEPVDVTAMAEGLVEELRERHAERPVRVRVQPGLHARADLTLLRIALNNLLSNATKYSSRVKEPLVEVFATEEDGETVYHVRDNGVGFSPEEASRLFRPFSRLSTAQGFDGTGLGLAMVHRVVTRHGGRIWASAEPGRGATFSFTLPPESDGRDQER